MARKKGKKSTPEGLDFLFRRKLISEDQYGEFWKEWWDSNKREQQTIINRYIEEEGEKPKETGIGQLTSDKKLAEFQARLLGGYVIRRDRTGKFSKRGKIFQAIKQKRKKK
jgi:hypothetical protein